MTAYHPLVPLHSNNDVHHRLLIAQTANNCAQGKINCTAVVTLNPNSTSTIFFDSRIGATSAVTPAMALTANGATAIKNGIYITNIVSAVGSTPGSCVINHANNSATDQTITFTIIG